MHIISFSYFFLYNYLEIFKIIIKNFSILFESCFQEFEKLNYKIFIK